MTMKRWMLGLLARAVLVPAVAVAAKAMAGEGCFSVSDRQVLERPVDALKQPYVLDFLDLPWRGRSPRSRPRSPPRATC